MIAIDEVLRKLSVKRPIFHSEADFQHALSWEIHLMYPEAVIRLEYPYTTINRQYHIDIWVSIEGKDIAIELKYKTRDLSVTLKHERYSLKGHSAQDCGRYDFALDVQRIEDVTRTNRSIIGYAIMLTNDSSYWKFPEVRNTVDAAFRIHDGRVLGGSLQWGAAAGKGTTHGREAEISLKGSYPIRWKDYSSVSASSYGKFRYTTLAVGN